MGGEHRYGYGIVNALMFAFSDQQRFPQCFFMSCITCSALVG